MQKFVQSLFNSLYSTFKTLENLLNIEAPST